MQKQQNAVEMQMHRVRIPEVFRVHLWVRVPNAFQKTKDKMHLGLGSQLSIRVPQTLHPSPDTRHVLAPPQRHVAAMRPVRLQVQLQLLRRVVVSLVGHLAAVVLHVLVAQLLPRRQVTVARRLGLSQGKCIQK